MSTFYLVDQVTTTTEYSHITDLEVMMVDGQARLFASTHFDGALTSWTLTPTGVVLTDAVDYRGGLQAGGTGSIMQITVDGVTSLLTGGGTAAGALQTHDITATGLFAGRDVFGSAATPLAGLTHGETLTLGNGTQAIYGGLAGADGIGRLVLDTAGNVQSASVISDRTDVFAADVSAVAAIAVEDTQYVLTASGTENGVTVWDVANDGALTQTDSIGTDDGLWIAAPTAMEIATIGTQTYVVLASAGSSSLSVMSLDAAGSLEVTDHVLDSQNSRFASASALTVIEHHGNIYVVVGGADDGISLFLLRADGTLLARGHLADTTQMGLENVSAISAVSVGDGIDIFVASSQAAGITQLHFATGPAGQTLQATAAGGNMSGTAGMDILNGAAGNDRLIGGGGADVLSGGRGADKIKGGGGNDILNGNKGNDVLTGGGGHDTFIFADGNDTITDFSIRADQLHLDDQNWGGQLSAQDVVDQYAQVKGGSVVFDFGGNDTLTLTGLTNLNALVDVISIV